MKKCILSAIAGALAMLAAMIIAVNVSAAKERIPEDYEHIDYISIITQENAMYAVIPGASPAPFTGERTMWEL